jgi:polar amino acid transport system substrate-binding protein
LAVALALAVASLELASCKKVEGEAWPTLGAAQIEPPTIVSPGVLRVGVDSSNPPYAGTSASELIGLDVDIAAALAEQLGLKLDLVDIAGQDVNVLFMEERIDIVMGYKPPDESYDPYVLVGPYLETGPAVFTKGLALPTGGFSLDTLSGMRIAAQPNSLSAWQLEQRFGVDAVQGYGTLEEAFDAVDSGAISYAAADAVVGAYLSGKHSDILCLGFIESPSRVYIAIKPGNQAMTDAATTVLRTLRDNGVLSVITNKWLGPTATALVLNTNAITGASDIGSGVPNTDLGDDLPDPSNADGTDSSDDNP